MAFNPPLLQLPAGLGWSYTVTPKYSTISQVPQSGRHPAQATLQESTIFDLELTFEYMEETGYVYLKEFYEAMRGSYGWFLFDPSQYGLDVLAVTQDYTHPSNGFCYIQPADNALQWSTSLNQSPWVQSEIASVTGGTTDPTGGTTAFTIVTGPSVGAGAYIAQGPSGLAAQSGWEMTFSVWLKVPTGGPDNIAISIQDNSGFTTTVCAVTTTWQRFSVTKTSVSGPSNCPCYIGWNGTAGISSNITFEAAWPQLESGPTPNTYVPTGATAIPPIATIPMWRATSVLGGGNVTLLERIQNVTLLLGVFINGTRQTTGFTTSNLPAQIVFTTPPAIGSIIAWEGNYNYLCHFSEDTLDFEEFIYQLRKMKSLKLETINL